MSNRRPSPPSIPGRVWVGWVYSSHGLRGEIFVRLKAGQADWAEDLRSFDLLPVTREGAIPGDPKSTKNFKVLRHKVHKDGLIVLLEGVNDRTAADQLRKSLVYIDAKLLQTDGGAEFYLGQILDFEVFQKPGILLGRVVGFASNGPQDLLQVMDVSGEEMLIPLVAGYDPQIDFKAKTIRLDLPEGLLDVNRRETEEE